jgi:lysophospholipase L1-like esterase
LIVTKPSPILRIARTVVFSFAVASCDKLGLGNHSNPAAPSSPPASGSTIVYAAIGASDAAGVGSSVQCVPFTDCPNGMGYVQVVTRHLKDQGFNVDLWNLGVPTSVIGPDFESLGRQYGRTIAGNFIDYQMPFVPRNATLVTIFAGVNEVNTITAALGGGAGGSNPQGYIDEQVRAFAADYSVLIDGIRSRAGNPRIVILNVPNVGSLPFLAGATIAQRQAAQRAAVAMTRTSVNPMATKGVTVIDVMCDTRTYQPSTYSSDGLHPNDAGYANLAAEVVRAILSGTYPPPQSTCEAMTQAP